MIIYMLVCSWLKVRCLWQWMPPIKCLCFINPTSHTLSNASWAVGGGRFMPAPSRLTIITVKNQNFFFDFLKLYNELGKVKFFQVSIIWFRGCNSSFSLGGALNAPPPTADRVKRFWKSLNFPSMLIAKILVWSWSLPLS